MQIIDYLMLAIGATGLVLGYRRNSRNALLVSALLLCVALGMRDFASGFQHGYAAPLGQVR